ncbi:shikimate dehydrogenase [Metabacillus iocasae]|uniref:Shikimate dehydrogenase (NADP(+)) n=1 Tax=Priestia iocasae TaxID=2291674 RepID=A0ABS2QQE9_9BACI|nr:shikimate dehydrogenase [Metabacillus iocasae]MBM7701448.1 shikimate dehydrogenase [Metabacillus iocasae]
MSKLYGLVGYPVGHSLSPIMHNDAFQRLKINSYYHAFHIEPNQFSKAVEGLKALGVSGFNVTIPYKVDIMPLLDEVDSLAQAIGAVNTVVNDNGRYIGYNTDGQGYVASLVQALENDSLENKRILIIGAGGAAKAIFYTLAVHSQKPVEISICNRTVEKAELLIKHCPTHVPSFALSVQEAEEQLERFDVVINTTSVGMSPNIEETPLNLDLLKPGALVSDIIYNPFETKLLASAKAKGAQTHNGIGMFVLQGALAFEKWTGMFPNQQAMEAIVRDSLKKG